jgi:hypothetical protein
MAIGRKTGGRTKGDGNPRFGGRQKGTPNRFTRDLKEWLSCR